MKLPFFFCTAALLIPTLAQAAPNACGSRTALIERLTEHFGETRQAIGLAGRQQVMELWGSVDTGTWTIVITLPDGRACLAASGQALEILQEAPAARGEQT